MRVGGRAMLGAVVLAAAASCFSDDPLPVSEGDTGGADTTTTGDLPPDTTSADDNPHDSSEEGADESSGSSSESGTPCEAGEPGCPCAEPPGPPCDASSVCEDGLCVPLPVGCGNGDLEKAEDCDDGANLPGDGCSPTCTFERMCLVVHAGGESQTRLISIPVDVGGNFMPAESLLLPGAHAPVGEEIGPEALAACGRDTFVALRSGSIAWTRTEPSGALTLVDTSDLPIPLGVDAVVARTIHCAPAARTAIVVAEIQQGNDSELVAFAIETDDAGFTTTSPAAGLNALRMTPFESVRSDYAPGAGLYLVYDLGPDLLQFRRLPFADGVFGGLDSALTGGLRDRVNALALSPGGDYLVVAGTRQAGLAFTTARVPLDAGGALPETFAFNVMADPRRAEVSRGTSVVFGQYAETPVTVLGSVADNVAIADFEVTPPVAVGWFQAPTDPIRNVELAYGDSLLLGAGGTRVRSYDFTTLPGNIGDVDIASVSIDATVAYSTVLSPCPGPL